MTRNNKILVFSGIEKENLITWKKFNGFNDDRYDFVSSLEEFQQHILADDYKQVIIDSGDLSAPSDILKAIAQTVRLKITVTLINLKNDIHVRSENRFEGNENSTEVDSIFASEKTKTREEEKPQIISQIAATLAHEINNPLLTISASADILLKNYSGLDKNVVEKIKMIGFSADRIRDVVEKLMELRDFRPYDTVAGKMIKIENPDNISADNMLNREEFVVK